MIELSRTINESFSKEHPLLQIAWDSTSVGLYKTCPRKYYLSIVCSYISKDDNIHLTFGILYHRGQELFHKALFSGKSFEEALILTTRFLLESTWDSKRGRPWISDDPNKNRFTLIRTFVWHALHYKDDPIKTLILDNRPAVELSFHYQSSYKTPDGEPYLLCGHLDRIGDFNSQTLIVDYKTTKYDIRGPDFFQFFSPDNQMTTYTFAGKIIYNSTISGVAIDAAQILVSGTRFQRGFTHRTEAQLNEWYKELGEYWLPLAYHSAVANSWPMNESACGRYGGCAFRGICGKDPSVRQAWLQASFSTRLWDPIKIRGDI